jgi:hypothetical protein
MKTLTSTRLVIDALGGNRGVAALLGTTNKAVSNWRRSQFPANTYVALQLELVGKGIFAPNWLWAMKKVKRKRKRKGLDNERVDRTGRRQI